MQYEEHPDPEGAAGRLGAPTIATVLLIVTVAAILALPVGPVQTTTLVVAVVLQVAVIIARAVMVRRAARPVDRPMRWHQFAFMWGATSGTNVLINTLGDGSWSATAALVVVGQQFLVSVFVVVVLWLNENAAPPEWWPRHWWPRRRRTTSEKPGGNRPRTVQLVERSSGATPPGPPEVSE